MMTIQGNFIWFSDKLRFLMNENSMHSLKFVHWKSGSDDENWLFRDFHLLSV